MTLLKINRLLTIYISIVPLKFEVDIQSQSKVRVRKPKNPIWRPFWKRHRWKSIGFCLWPPSTCIWSLKLKFQSKLDLCSGNHVVYRQTDGRTDRRTDGRTRWIQYTPPPTSLGGGIKIVYRMYSLTVTVHLESTKWTEMLPSKIMSELVIYSTQWQVSLLVQERAWCYLDIQPLFGMMMTKSCDANGCLLRIRRSRPRGEVGPGELGPAKNSATGELGPISRRTRPHRPENSAPCSRRTRPLGWRTRPHSVAVWHGLTLLCVFYFSFDLD